MDLTAHALNESFSWPDATGPFRLVSVDQAKAWNEQGYFLLENVISAADLEMLRAEIDPLEQKANLFLRGLEGKKQFIARADELTFFPHIVLRSNPVKAFVASRVFAELCLDLLGNDVRLYWDQAVYKKPGSPEEFPWHQDNGYTFIRPQDYLTCWIPLVDATVENGCPWVVPGVHKMGTLSHWTTDLGYQCLKDVENAVPVPARAGNIVVFSSLTPHRTGPNLTTDERKAYIVQYAHDGSRMFLKDGADPVLQDHADRQFPVVRGGSPVLGNLT